MSLAYFRLIQDFRDLRYTYVTILHHEINCTSNVSITKLINNTSI